MFQVTFNLEFASELELQQEAITSGLLLFEKLFRYKAEFFVPPSGPFNISIKKVAFEGGIEYMSASKIQYEVFGEGKTRKKLHYLGQRNNNGQLYITRNCFFEPNQPGKHWISSCLNEIDNAFKWKKPAIISSHRVNYKGIHNPKNRDLVLKPLEVLLKEIISKWPDVEFITSNELDNLLNK